MGLCVKLAGKSCWSFGCGFKIRLSTLCLSGRPFADLRGGCASCRDRSLGFDAAFAMGPYDGALRELCLRLKHEQNAWLAPCLSELLVEARRDAFSNLPSDALVVPVPLHWWRHWRRGYNQAESLAEGVAKRLKLPIHRLLKRVVGTRAARRPESYRAGRSHAQCLSRSRLIPS